MSIIYLVALKDNSEGVFFREVGDAYYAATGNANRVRGMGVSSLASDFRERFDDWENFNMFEVDLEFNTVKQSVVGDD